MTEFINRDELISIPNKNMGKLFKQVRKKLSHSPKNPKKCMTQEEMAEFIDVDLRTYINWELGDVVPEDYKLINFAWAFEVDPNRFLDLKFNISSKRQLELYSKLYNDNASLHISDYLIDIKKDLQILFN